LSLIDEALKRARHEAARQEAVKRDAARHDGPRPVPKLYAERSASRAPLWAGIATGAAVALLGVVAWLLWGRAPSASPATVLEPSVVAAEGPKAAVAAPAPAPDAAAKTPERAEPVAERSRETAPVPEGPKPAPSPVAAAPPIPPGPPAIRPAPAPPAVSAPRAAAPSSPSGAAPQVYVREAALPGGGPRLRLGGIAYSEEAPIALINGAALGRGEVVEGYVVRRIDAAEVELEGPAGRVVLRLK
jgi:hypothetical protein